MRWGLWLGVRHGRYFRSEGDARHRDREGAVLRPEKLGSALGHQSHDAEHLEDRWGLGVLLVVVGGKEEGGREGGGGGGGESQSQRTKLVQDHTTSGSKEL